MTIKELCKKHTSCDVCPYLPICGDMPADYESGDDLEVTNAIIETAKVLQPQPKTGHWIEIAQYSDGKHKIECSECKGHIFSRGHANSFVVKNEYKFCPHCGVRMVEPQKKARIRNEQMDSRI